LADISKINGVPIANIEKLDAVLAANIAKVNGLTFALAPAFTGLLDTYTGAAAGYSTRRLASSATNLMRIREASGDTETDIGYDSNGDLDVAAIASHCGTADGFVVSWVDQSGNGNDADQSTNANQPKIYDGTTQAVITENGKPALEFEGDKLGHFNLAVPQPYTFNFVGRYAGNTAVSFAAFFGHADGPAGTYVSFLVRTNSFMMQAPNLVSATAADTNQHNFFLLYDGSSSLWAFDGGTTTTINPGTHSIGNFAVGARGTDSGSTELRYFQELVLWSSDQSTNRSGIEENINSDYLIYQPTDAPTSGLLATYTGAAAAYSVRQLSDKAVIALRIRRDSDDAETNIGWDANGDLDTTAISDFCGTANGYVTRWWDQSTNGNHADQATDTSQPQIYNGTAVIKDSNNVPELLCSDDRFNLSSTISLTSGYSCIHVSEQSGRDSASFGSTSSFHYITLYQSSNVWFYHTNSGRTLSYVVPLNTKQLHWLNWTGSTVGIGINAGTLTTGALSTSTEINLLLNASGNLQSGWRGRVQEMIIYPSNQSTNRTGIESDINTYFSIY
jgi:hypothetical protein